MGPHLNAILEVRLFQALDLDAEGRVLAGSDETAVPGALAFLARQIATPGGKGAADPSALSFLGSPWA